MIYIDRHDPILNLTIITLNACSDAQKFVHDFSRDELEIALVDTISLSRHKTIASNADMKTKNRTHKFCLWNVEGG